MTEAGTKNAMLAAAEAGDDKAQCELAMMFEHGIGCPKDYAAAAKWYTAAADANNGFAAYKLALMAENGALGGAPDMKQAASWLRRAAEAGLSEAQHKLGIMLDTGKAGEENPKEAAQFLAMAAEQGVADAQWRLGSLYEQGRGVKRDYEAAAKLYQAASAQGNLNAHYGLGVLYVTGEGVPVNPAEALRLFTMAADAGHTQAKRRLSGVKLGVNPGASSGGGEPAADPGDDGLLHRYGKKREEKPQDDDSPMDFGPAFWIGSVMQAGVMSVVLAILVLTPIGDMVSAVFKAVGWPLAVLALVGALIALLSTLVFFKKRKEQKSEDGWYKIACTAMAVIGAAIVIGVIGFSKFQFADPETAKQQHSATQDAAKALMDKAQK